MALRRVARAASSSRSSRLDTAQAAPAEGALRPGRGELDRERQAFEARADLRDERGVRRRQLERAACGPGALDEEQLGRTEVERRHQQLVLAGDVQRRAARDEQVQLRRRGQQPGDVAGCVEQLLEVVEHEQQRPVGQRARERLDVVACSGREPEGLRNGRQDELRVDDRPERYEVGAAGELRLQIARNLLRDPRLADASGAGQRHQPDAPGPAAARSLRPFRAPGRASRSAVRASSTGPVGERVHPAPAPGGGSAVRARGGAAPVPARARQRAAASLGVDGERLGLPPRAVQGEHQLRAQPLAVGVLEDKALELCDQPVVPAELEIGVDASLERPSRASSSRAASRSANRSGTSQSAGPRQSASASRSSSAAASASSRPAEADEALEPGHVEAALVDLERIAGGAGRDQPAVLA